MRFLKLITLPLILSGLIVLNGCGNSSGDLAQDKTPGEKLGTKRFTADCELNIDEFAKIMEEDIRPSIQCLGKNLHLFIDIVKTDKPGYLRRIDLQNYIQRNRSEIRPEVLKAMQAVFDLNYLIFGDTHDFISKQNVDELVEFVSLFNRQAWENYKTFFDYSGNTSYDTHRRFRNDQIAPAARKVLMGLKKIFKPNQNGQPRKLSVRRLIDAFKTENNRNSLEKIERILFVKKVLLGGHQDVLTHVELNKLISNFDSLVVLGYDLVRFKKVKLVQNDMVNFLKQDVDLLSNMVFGNSSRSSRAGEHMFSLHELIEAIKIFTEDSDFNPEKYRDLIKEAKIIVMGGDELNVKGKDLRTLFDHVKHVLDTGIYFHRFYAAKESLLRKPFPLDDGVLRDLELQFPTQKPRVQQFIRIVKNYRFMKGKFSNADLQSAYYSYDWYRNSNGVYEASLFEYAFNLVMKRYGCPGLTVQDDEGKDVPCDSVTPPPGLYGDKKAGESDKEYYERVKKNYVYMKKDHVISLIKRFSDVMIDLDLILPGRQVKTSETITLLGSLFQYQSDENKVFDVNEATEFATSLFTSIDFSKKMYDFYKTKQGCNWDFKKSRIDPECFKKYYWEGVCKIFPNQYPKLFEAIGATTGNRPNCNIALNTDNLAYLDRAIDAARTCNYYPKNKQQIYFSKGDMMSVFMAMMHIETTILRWDMNRNNIMDPNEVMDAYKIYSPALDGFLEDKSPIIKMFKRQIYQFLVMYEEVPNEKDRKSIIKFIKFLLKSKRNKQAPAKRKTVASILVAIGAQGAVDHFDCNLMENPDLIPRDYDPRPPVENSLQPAGNYSNLLIPYLYLAE